MMTFLKHSYGRSSMRKYRDGAEFLAILTSTNQR